MTVNQELSQALYEAGVVIETEKVWVKKHTYWIAVTPDSAVERLFEPGKSMFSAPSLGELQRVAREMIDVDTAGSLAEAIWSEDPENELAKIILKWKK